MQRSLVFSAALILSALMSGVAFATIDSHPYTYTALPGGTRKDPINLVSYRRGTLGNTESA